MRDVDREEIRIDYLVPPWGAKEKRKGWSPPTWPVNEAAASRHAASAELKAEQAAQLDPVRLAEIARLYDAHAVNMAQQNEAHAARQALAAPLPDTADLAAVAARAREREDVERYLAVLAARCAQSGLAFSDAVGEVRGDLWVASEADGGVVRRLRAERRQIAKTIADLEQRDGQLEMLIMDVTGKLKAWNWPADAPTEAPVAEQPAPARRKRLFGGT